MTTHPFNSLVFPVIDFNVLPSLSTSVECFIAGHLNPPPYAILPLRTPKQQRFSWTRTK